MLTVPPAAEFNLLAKTMLASRGKIADAQNYANNAPRNLQSERVKNYLEKDAVGAMNTSSDLGYRGMTTAFFESLRTTSAYARMMTDKAIRTVPPKMLITASTYAFSGNAVSEGAPKPVRELMLAGHQLPEYKATCLLVVSDEIAKLATSEATNFLGAEQKAVVSAGVDRVFFEQIIDSSTPVIPSSGISGNAILGDLADLIVSVRTAGQLYFIAHSETAKALSVAKSQDGTRAFPEVGLQGGELLGAPLMLCDELNAGDLLLVNASAFVGNLGTITLDASEHAAIIMNSAPEDAEDTLISLWQTNSRCLRAEVFFGFEQYQSDAVALLTGLVLPVNS